MTAPIVIDTPASAPGQRTNTMAILSLVFAFLFWPLSIVFGHIARGQIKATGEQGKGLATAGLAISYSCLAVLVAILATGIGVAASGGPAPIAPSFSATAPAAPTMYAPAGTYGDGTYIIGTEMPAGTYRSAGPATSVMPACVWQRLTNTSGEYTAAAASGISQGPAVITVSAADRAFTTTGCQPWTKIS